MDIQREEMASKASKDATPEREIRIKPINRKQLVLRPTCIEELVASDHPVRAIWEVTGRLDLKLFYDVVKAADSVAGRSAWDPRVMISLWILAYSEGLSSAREISRRCERSPAYQWLTGLQVINHHSLADFRVDHEKALHKIFVDVLGILSAEGLVTLERVMHDGTKVKAFASSDTFRREERIREHLELAKKHVQEMGEQKEDEVSERVRRSQQRHAREREEKLKQALEELEKIRETKKSSRAKEEARVSITDPEARIMKQGDGGYAPSYNVQVSTDAPHGAIVSIEATQSCSDFSELMPAVERITDDLGKAPQEMVFDGGFTSRENLLNLHEKKVEAIGSLKDTTETAAAQFKRRGIDVAEFGPEAFQYEAQSDTYRCPQGNVLEFQSIEKQIGKNKYIYRANPLECQACPSKDKCCPEAKARSTSRSIEDPVIMAFKEKMETEEAKAIYKQRGPVAEFSNLWLKSKIGLRQFRLQGLNKVNCEVIWAALTLNIQLWTRLKWQPT